MPSMPPATPHLLSDAHKPDFSVRSAAARPLTFLVGNLMGNALARTKLWLRLFVRSICRRQTREIQIVAQLPLAYILLFYHQLEPPPPPTIPGEWVGCLV